MSSTTDNTDSAAAHVTTNDNFWGAFLFHLKRLQMWRLRLAKVTKKECRDLLEEGVENHLMQKFLGWRRSLLLFSLPSVLLSAIFSFVGLLGIDFEPLNGLGVVAVIVELISPSILFVGVCFSWVFWKKHLKSANCCAYAWLFSLIAPIWPALLPMEYLIDFDLIQQADIETLFMAKLYLGISYSLHLLPLIVTIPAGALKGSLRIHGLLPESSLPGWFIVLIAPIVPLTICAAVVLVTQLLGDVMLLVGVSLLLVAPMLYVFRRHLYTEILTEGQDQAVEWNQRITTILSFSGVAIIGIWALANDIFPNVIGVLRFFTEWVGRSLTSTVLFADTVFRMTIHQMRVDRKKQDEGHLIEVENLLSSISSTMGQDEAVGNDKNEEAKDVEEPKQTMPDTTESTEIDFSLPVSAHLSAYCQK